MNIKAFYVTYGPRENARTVEVALNGVSAGERLTPKLAERAALVGAGHRSGVTVTDGKVAYRLYANTHRKVAVEYND